MNEVYPENVLSSLEDDEAGFSLLDFPMHYFAAIQRRNLYNLQIILRPYGVTPTEWRILSILHERGAMGMNALTEITVTDRSKTSRHVFAMEKNGILSRSTLARDKRNSSVTLTDLGIEKHRLILPIVKKVYSENFKGVTVAEFQQLMDVLSRIKDNVNRSEAYIGLH